MHSIARVALIGLLASQRASAEALDPFAFSSGGAFPTTPTVVIDSSSFTVDGAEWSGVFLLPQLNAPDLAVFTFDGGAVAGAAQIQGSLPVAVLFQGEARIAGEWLVYAGSGSGDGAGFNSESGGTGGGGFGGAGGQGGGFTPGGIVYGDLFNVVEAGSNGGARGFNQGGSSGGAVEIGAVGLLDLSGATVIADGNDGADILALGGGSGGGIFLHAFSMTLDAATTLRARGGRGGDDDPTPFVLGYGAGGGGGGRVAVLWNLLGSFTRGGSTIDVSGGSAGAGDLGTVTAGGTGSFAGQSSPTIGVPEPGQAALAGVALGALTWCRRATRRSRAAVITL